MINTNLHPMSRRFQVAADYWSNLRFRQGVPPFNALVWSEPTTTKAGLKKLETSLYGAVQNAFRYLEPFKR